MMSRRLVLLALCVACMSGPCLSAAEVQPPAMDPHLADAYPETVRAAFNAAEASEALHDYGTASVQLRRLRAMPHLRADFCLAIDRQRAAIGAFLAAEDLAQARRQEADGQWAYAERFYLQALNYSAAAALELRRLWSDPAAIKALGEAKDHDLSTRLSMDQQSAGVRWRLAGLDPVSDWNAAARASDDLERLLDEAGSQDADLRAWTHQLLTAVPRLSGAPSEHVQTLARLEDLGRLLFGDTDPQVAGAAAFSASTVRMVAIASHGSHELTLSARVAIGFMRVASARSASATPDAASASFAPRSSQESSSSSGTAGDLEVRLMREETPGGRTISPVYGLGLQLLGGSTTLALPIADADTGAASLTGATYQSRLSLQALDLSAIGGARFALGARDGVWSISCLGSLGLASVHDALGTRPEVVNGGTGSSSISGSGIEPSFGLEADLTWRPGPTWSLVGELGWSYLKLPSISGSAATTFVSSAGSSASTGVVQTSIDGLHAQTLWLGIGVQRSW